MVLLFVGNECAVVEVSTRAGAGGTLHWPKEAGQQILFFAFRQSPKLRSSGCSDMLGILWLRAKKNL